MYKDNANRKQNQVYLNYVEVPLMFWKDNANRKQNQVYPDYVEVQLMVSEK